MAEDTFIPSNPTMRDQTPRYNGTLYEENGQLNYFNPLTSHWVPAVKLDTIRPRLVAEANPDQYDYPKKRGFDDTDVTTFLAKDKAFGTSRQTRPPILFQIIRPNGLRGQEPKGYLMDRGRIVLDPFSHGIRNFPELPKCLSSELEGQDVMYYLRQNQFLKQYDILARMPSKFRKSEEHPWQSPRYGSIGMRATRFRALAGLVTWTNRDGSELKNLKILSMLPAACKDPSVNSTRAFRDLNKAERDSIENMKAMPNRARKVKRDREELHRVVAKPEDEDTPIANEAEADWESFGKIETTHVPEEKQRSKRSAFRAQLSDNNKGFASRRRLVTYTESSEDELTLVEDDKDKGCNLFNKKSPEVEDNDGSASSDMTKEVEAPVIADEAPKENPLDNTEPSMGIVLTNALQDRDTLNARLINARANANQISPTMEQEARAVFFAETREIDYRYTPPDIEPDRASENIAAVQQILDVCRMDYLQRTDELPPAYIAKRFKLESFSLQRTRLQEHLSKIWKGPGFTPQLYWLKGWKGGFKNWRSAVTDPRGQELLQLMSAELETEEA